MSKLKNLKEQELFDEQDRKERREAAAKKWAEIGYIETTTPTNKMKNKMNEKKKPTQETPEALAMGFWVICAVIAIIAFIAKLLN